MKSFIKYSLPLIFISQMLHASTENYCVAIRGNGEGMPAHWGALSALVQKKGMPQALAGGSSASISIFLLESLSLNARAKNNVEKSFLIKSFQGYFEALTQTAEGKALAALIADKNVFAALIESAKKMDQLKITPSEMALFQKHLTSLQTLMNSEEFRGLLNPEFLAYVKETQQLTADLANGKSGVKEGQVSFRKDQISKAIKNFGKFNAQTDETLFFRPGLISFSHLAQVLGQMGDFYSGHKLKNSSAQKQIDQDMDQFLKICSPGSAKLSWRQINEHKPVCRQLLGRAVLTFRTTAQSEGFKGKRIYDKIGSHLATFPTTSVLIGQAVPRFRKARELYKLNDKLSFDSDFLVAQSELRFGYWGNEENLKKIESSLRYDQFTKTDEKSKKFLGLGSKSWLTALSASPAEPGLSNLVDLNQELISAGGWNDLHPTLILRAHGCQNIVYLTRRGGESMFAQGVIKKLTQIDGFNWSDWENLTASQRTQKNAQGETSDVGHYATLWSKLYNMANPESSIRKSMSAASTTICSDWDNFDPRADLNGLIEDAFRAPWLTDSQKICR